MRSVTILFVFAGLVGYAFAGLHHHLAHGHRRRQLIPHAENLEPRDLAWDGQVNIPGDVVVESITRTTTTTVFGYCAPTSTSRSTLTLVKAKAEPTVYTTNHLAHNHTPPAPFQAQRDQPEPQPGPPAPKPTESEETTTMYNTKTITKTATHTVRVTVHPGANPTHVADSSPRNPSKAGNAIPLARTLPKGSTEERKNIQTKNTPPPPPNSGPLNAVFDLPGQVIPDIHVIDQILPGSQPAQSAPLDWTATVPGDRFLSKGFGGRTSTHGKEIHYHGNVGTPWGSNIITIRPEQAHQYKYVAQFTGSNVEPWTVVFWNKFGPDGKMTGWYGHSAVSFSLAPGETRYVAFDEDSEGAWGAAPGDHLPTDQFGGYSCTWGEFTFGDGENHGWSGWDVSAIQAQAARHHVQGMSICQANGKGCSIITPHAKKVVDAYTHSKKHLNGIGGSAAPGPVRLKVLLDYRG
ncbi:hypothetical protein N7457_003740 [Penicillium paradoxum]|uniref:uncharacterized protein n=1 Tax=Penicillium paradoxum TaxID=176176 RepID=UPI0025467E02|nr:uncharacterized protein N7457_003740 [Penicillium paradoxum]KAJ5788750.1 hypothetical protein N7457_003740 [Penicillium paradoxum]